MNARRHTFAIDASQPDLRVRVSEAGDRGFLAIDTDLSSRAVLLEPAQLVALAGELLNVATSIIDRRFQQLDRHPRGRTEI